MILRLLFTTLLVAVGSAHAAVKMQVNDTLFAYDKPVRLSRILFPVVNQAEWYWPASQLFDLGDWSAQNEQKLIVYAIDKLSMNLDRSEPRYASLQAVRHEVNNWVVRSRLSKAVSFYPARLNIENNPLFSNGHYLLRLTERPQHIEVTGAVADPRRYPHSGNETLNRLVAHLTLLPGADNSYLYVIYPDGRVLKRGYAYWNESHAALMPGSTIVVPIAAGGDDALTELNQRIAELAVNREVRND